MEFKKLLTQSILWRGLYFATLFLVNVALSRFLLAEGAGEVYFISNTFAFFHLIAGFCLEGSITYFVASKKIAAHRVFWLCLLWTFVVVIAFLLLLLFWHSEVALLYPQMKVPVYAISFIVGLMLTNYGCALFYAEGAFLLPNALLAGVNTLFVATATIVFIQTNNTATIIDLYFLSFIIQGVGVMLAWMVQHKSWQHFALPANGQLAAFFRYAVQVLASNLLFFLVYRIDYYFVQASPAASAADLGNYMQVSKLGQMLIVLPQIIASAVYPQMSSGQGRQQVSNAVMLLSRVFSVAYLILMLATAIAGNLIFTLIFGPTFNHMQVPMLLLLPGLFCVSVLVILSSFFSGKGNVRISVYAALWALMVVLAGNILLVPRYGIEAAAFVSTIGYGVNLLFLLLQFKKDYHLPAKYFIGWRKKDWTLLYALIKKG